MGGAIEFADAAIEFWKNYPGDIPIRVHAQILRASLYMAERKPHLAHPLFREALAIHKRHFKNQHTAVAACLNNLGNALKELERLEEAEESYVEALDILESNYPDGHPNRAIPLDSYGALLLAANRLDEALECFEEALDVRLIYFGEHNRDTARSLSNLGEFHSAAGNLEESAEYYRRALAANRASHPEGAVIVIEGLLKLASVECSLDPESAMELLEQYFLLENDPNRRFVGESIKGECLMRLGQYQEADKLLRRSHEVLRRSNFRDVSQQRLDELDRLWKRDSE